MKPTWRDVGRTAAAFPFLLFLFALAHNEYLFGPKVVDAVLAAVAVAGLLWRVVRKTRAHTPFWMVFVLYAYNVPIWLGGFLFVPVTAALLLPPSLGLGWLILRKHPRPFFVALGLMIWWTTGFVFLHTERHLDLDERLGRCASEEARLDPAARVIDREKHPYDFLHYVPPAAPGSDEPERDEWIVGAYGLSGMLRWFEPESSRWVRNTPLSGWQKIQRLAVSHDGRYVLGAPWGNRGQREFVLAVDPANTSEVSKIPVEDCRNVYELFVDPSDGRIVVLCEVSHSLTALDARTYAPLGSVVVPGRDSYDVAFDPERRRLFVTDYWSPDVSVVDLDTFALTDTIRVGWSSMGAVVYRDRLYVARPLAAQVVEIDLSTLRVTRRMSAGYGARDLEIDARRGLLYVGNYFAGTLDALDLSTGERAGRAFVGRLLRGLMLDTARDRLYLATGCGAKIIEPARWLPDRTAPPDDLQLPCADDAITP